MGSVWRVGNTWTAAWFVAPKKRRYARGLPTRAMAEQVVQKYEYAKQAVKHGLAAPGSDKFLLEADRPLDAHLEDFTEHLRLKKNSAQYISETERDVRRIFKDAGITRIDRIDREAVERAVDRLVKLGRAHRTRNKAMAACRAFCGYLDDKKRIPVNPLRKMKELDPELDRRRVRNALTVEQAVHLIDTTDAQPTRGGMSGKDRMVRYALGIGTGFRQRTLFTLTPESFHLDGDPPFIRVEATNTKGRKSYDQPIREDLAALLRPWLAGRPKRVPVFGKLPYARTMNAYRHDLEAAGIVYHEDETNLYCDLHAQRNAFITAVIRAAGLKVAQDLAHHSTPVLTSKYARLGMSDYVKGLEGLPPVGAMKEKSRKTG